MTCNVLATGSKGNAVVLEDMLLLDCGIPWKLLEPYARGLRLVLLTHEHGDHFRPSTVRRLHQERPALRFGCCQWMAKPLVEAGVDSAQIDIYEPGKVFTYGDTSVEPFELVHDVRNCGYKLRIGGKLALYATDTAGMDGVEAKGYDLYMLEANYGTEAELAERIRQKTEDGGYVYEYRAAACHMSREQADAWLALNAEENRSQVIYLHQHKGE